jgi:hypothetical protein
MKNNDFYNYIYLVACFIIIKKDKIFHKKYWDKYFTDMYEQNELMYIFNYIDFKKYSNINILKKNDLPIESFYSFVYGADEIWLNYIIKKLLLYKKKINKLDVYIVNDYNLKVILFKLNDLFKYNSLTNEQFTFFIKNCFFLKNKNYINLEQYINNLKEDKDIISFFNELKNNPYFNRLYIQNNIKYTICNIEFLMKKRNKLKLTEIMTSVKYKNL